MLSKLKLPSSEIAEGQEGAKGPTCDGRFCEMSNHEVLLPVDFKSQNPFYCHECDVGFALEESYKLHLEGPMHNYDDHYTCNHCGAKFFLERELRSHEIFTHKYEEPEHSNQPQKCIICYHIAMQKLMEKLEGNPEKATERKLKLLRLRRRIVEREIFGSSSPCSSTLTEERFSPSSPRQNCGAMFQPRDMSTVSVSGAEGIPASSSKGQKTHDNLRQRKKGEPTSMPKDVGKEGKKEPKSGSKDEPNLVVPAWKYLCGKGVRPPQKSYFVDTKQPTGRLSTSKSWELPRATKDTPVKYFSDSEGRK